MLPVSRYAQCRAPRWRIAVVLLLVALPFASVRADAMGTTYTATTVAALIADINAANATPAQGPYTITLATGGLYTLTAEAMTGSGTGLPAIVSGVDLTIIGNGATIQRNEATANLRLLLVNSGATLRLTALTLRDGQVTGAAGTNGGNGTGNSGVAGGFARGGAIYNNGALIVTRDTFMQNGVAGGAGGNGGSGASGGVIGGIGGNGGAGGNAAGGAIYNGGMLTITNSTFVANSATAGIGGSGGSAGTGTSGNGVDGYGANGGNGQGGTIANVANTSQFITNSTITTGGAMGGVGGTGRSGISGTGASMGGGVFNGGSGITLTNAIFSSNNATVGGNCAGNTLVDGGYNLEFNPATTCGFTNNAQSGDPLLGALANHGGPTQTVAVGSGSAAINHGNPTVCAGTTGSAPVGGVDQRGLPRPVGQCSIGAFEPQAPPTLTAMNPISGPVAGGSSVRLIGAGFLPGATITFGLKPSTTVTVINPTTITVTTPASIAGTVSVTVTNPDLQATSPMPYTYGTVATAPGARLTGVSITGSPAPLPRAKRPSGTPSGGGPPSPLPPHR
ncbi:MAG: IPT/TIG domain-containing protein [Chloroflexota bacterium]|nr:IPT/TIG domain-containing protein [Chloroflexota bacterium]